MVVDRRHEGFGIASCMFRANFKLSYVHHKWRSGDSDVNKRAVIGVSEAEAV
jgi:hypothetical protein